MTPDQTEIASQLLKAVRVMLPVVDPDGIDVRLEWIRDLIIRAEDSGL